VKFSDKFFSFYGTKFESISLFPQSMNNVNGRQCGFIALVFV